MTAQVIDAQAAHEHVQAGALLVCAYDDDLKFEQNRLEGALSLTDLRNRERTLAKDREIIFYCA